MNGVSSGDSLRNQGIWVISFAAYLFVSGIVGYLSNPAAAKTALISGSVFGAIMLIIGIALRREIGFARWIALALCGALAGVFTWRSKASWEAVEAGEPKMVAAIIITGMLVACLVTIARIFKG